MTGPNLTAACPVCDAPLADHLVPSVEARCAILAGADPADYPAGPPCRGAGRIGIVPGAGVDAPQAWAQYHDGKLRCAYCLQFVPHDGRGRLDPHSRPPRRPLAA